MFEQRVNDLTEMLMSKEKSLAYFVWDTGKQFGISASKEMIEDIISDAYLLAVSKLQRDVNLKIRHYWAWFIRILYLTSMNAFRKEFGNKKLINLDELEEVNHTNFIYETIDKNRDDVYLQNIIDGTLNNTEHQVIKMIIDGYSYKEIADKLAISEVNIRQAKARAVKKLSKVLKR